LARISRLRLSTCDDASRFSSARLQTRLRQYSAYAYRATLQDELDAVAKKQRASESKSLRRTKHDAGVDGGVTVSTAAAASMDLREVDESLSKELLMVCQEMKRVSSEIHGIQTAAADKLVESEPTLSHLTQTLAALNRQKASLAIRLCELDHLEDRDTVTSGR